MKIKELWITDFDRHQAPMMKSVEYTLLDNSININLKGRQDLPERLKGVNFISLYNTNLSKPLDYSDPTVLVALGKDIASQDDVYPVDIFFNGVPRLIQIVHIRIKENRISSIGITFK